MLTETRIKDAISTIIGKRKVRKFLETVELQIALKNYDPQVDKRFSGSINLPNTPRPKLKMRLVGDVKHLEEAKEKNLDIDMIDLDGIRMFNKNKRIIKRWQKSISVLVCTESLIRKMPAVLGPSLGKIGTFPKIVTHGEDLAVQVQRYKNTVKFQLRKHPHLSLAIGNVDMTEEELKQNIRMSISFLVSLCKNGWMNIGNIYIKTTMGRPYKLYS